MRKYVLPMVLCSALGSVIVVLVLLRREDKPLPTPVSASAPAATIPSARKPGPSHLTPRTTTTPLSENRALSELERVMARKDLKHAGYYRDQVCRQLDEILQSESLTRNLLDLVRRYGTESDDLKRRDVVLPILRVLRHPEATRMIATEFYEAKSEAERMMLIEAMSHKYHDPEMASVWAVDRALASESSEDRERSFQVIKDFSEDPELVFRTAKSIYDGTTRPKQSHAMIDEISQLGMQVEQARAFMRKKLAEPRAVEVGQIAARMDGWGTRKDAARLEALAFEFPAMGDYLRDRADAIRMAIIEKERGDKLEAKRKALDESILKRQREIEERNRKERDEDAAAEDG